VIQYVAQRAPAYGLDAAAVLSVANHEGLNTAPGSYWTLPGEFGISFGPPSWYAGDAAHPAAGTPIVAQQGSNAPNWAWTPSGLEYWLSKVAQVAQGLSVTDAIRAIVTGFERPAAQNVGPEIDNASHDYAGFHAQVTGVAPITDLPITSPGTTDTHPPGTIQVAPQVQAGSFVGAMQTLVGGWLGPGLAALKIKPDMSGLILLLASIFAIIIGALIWKGETVKEVAPQLAKAVVMA